MPSLITLTTRLIGDAWLVSSSAYAIRSLSADQVIPPSELANPNLSLGDCQAIVSPPVARLRTTTWSIPVWFSREKAMRAPSGANAGRPTISPGPGDTIGVSAPPPAGTRRIDCLAAIASEAASGHPRAAMGRPRR